MSRVAIYGAATIEQGDALAAICAGVAVLRYPPDAVWWGGGARPVETATAEFCAAHAIPMMSTKPDLARYGTRCGWERGTAIATRWATAVIAIWDDRVRELGGTLEALIRGGCESRGVRVLMVIARDERGDTRRPPSGYRILENDLGLPFLVKRPRGTVGG